VIVQGLSFLVLGSSWCDNEGCRFSRGGAFSVAAIAFFFVTGHCFFVMADYPGAKHIAAMKQGDVEAPMATAIVISDREDEPEEEEPYPEEVEDETHVGDEPREGNDPEAGPDEEEKVEAEETTGAEGAMIEETVAEGEEPLEGEDQADDDEGDVVEAIDIEEIQNKSASPDDEPLTVSDAATPTEEGPTQFEQDAEFSTLEP
jgi:hypothetical protein